MNAKKHFQNGPSGRAEGRGNGPFGERTLPDLRKWVLTNDICVGMKRIMKNHPSKLKAETGEKPLAAGKNPVLVVPECDSAPELLAFNDNLIEVLAREPAMLTMRFVGVHQMCPDSALLIVETMKGKSPKTKIVTEAWSSLIEGSALIWLSGDSRRIRSTAWLFFRNSQLVKNREPQLPWEMEGMFCPGPSFHLRERDYQTVLRLINRYLPVKDLADTPVTPHILSEYCLLEGQCAGEPEGTGASAAGTVTQPEAKSGEEKIGPSPGNGLVSG